MYSSLKATEFVSLYAYWTSQTPSEATCSGKQDQDGEESTSKSSAPTTQRAQNVHPIAHECVPFRRSGAKCKRIGVPSQRSCQS